MTSTRTVGLIGHGRIGRDVAERVRDAPDLELSSVLVRTPSDDLSDGVQTTDRETFLEHDADLVVEAATPEALADIGGDVLRRTDMMVLSGSAFADSEVERRLTDVAEEHGTRIYLPHAALLGIDGLVDVRDELESVRLEARKAPDHLDFAYTDELSPDDVDGETVLYEGPVRGLCELFPRNFNSHAAVALASLGLDGTESRLVADPAADTAHHVITATGPGFDLEIVRDSTIEGVTGDYTVVSIWGSIRRVLDTGGGLRFV